MITTTFWFGNREETVGMTSKMLEKFILPNTDYICADAGRCKLVVSV